MLSRQLISHKKLIYLINCNEYDRIYNISTIGTKFNLNLNALPKKMLLIDIEDDPLPMAYNCFGTFVSFERIKNLKRGEVI